MEFSAPDIVEQFPMKIVLLMFLKIFIPHLFISKDIALFIVIKLPLVFQKSNYNHTTCIKVSFL